MWATAIPACCSSTTGTASRWPTLPLPRGSMSCALAVGGFRWSSRRSPSALGRDSGLATTARARTASGRWITVRGWVLQNGSEARTAITLEPARGPELAELFAEAYGLTARERRVSKLVAQGLPNAAIAARLYLSTYTVQDHLKAIFEKLDVSNRGQLVARLFLDPYQRSAGA